MRSRCERMASQREASHLVCVPVQGFKARIRCGILSPTLSFLTGRKGSGTICFCQLHSLIQGDRKEFQARTMDSKASSPGFTSAGRQTTKLSTSASAFASSHESMRAVKNKSNTG